MTGDPNDIIWRIRSVIPTGWFADQSPILNSVLAGFAASWSWIYSFVEYALEQTRIATAFEFWLDLSAADFFGLYVTRRPGQSDTSFRQEILANLLCERATRQSVISVIQNLTSRTPVIFEPARCMDTGCYSTSSSLTGGLSYNVCGGWGSLLLPYQLFITAFRSNLVGIAYVSGWGCPSGAYCTGIIEYADLASMEDQIPDAQIYQVISGVLPISVVAWTKILN